MARQALAELAQHGAFARIMDSLGRRQQRLDELAYRLETALRRLLEQHRRRWEFAAAAVRYYDVRQRLAAIEEQLESRTAALAAAFRNALLERKSQLERLAGSLQALSPLAILERGYALVFDSSGKLIKDPDAVRAGDDISARVAKGEIRAVVKEKRA
jgi:exodeoxyribonuclease VII large subunit